MADHFYFKLKAEKWLASIKLRQVGFAPKGLWIDMLSLALISDPRGMLPYNGLDNAADHIAKLLGRSPAEIRPLLAELLNAGVPSVTEDGRWLYSDEMMREIRKSEKCSAAGRKGGGNPTFKGHPKGHDKGECNYNSNSYSFSVSDSSEGGCKGETDAGALRDDPPRVGPISGDYLVGQHVLGGLSRMAPEGKRGRPLAAYAAVQDALNRVSLMADLTDPVEFLRTRISAYYASPEGRSKFATSLPRWLSEGGYLQNDSAWSQTERPGEDVQAKIARGLAMARKENP